MMQGSLNPIICTTKKESVIDILRNEILSGRIRDGEELTQEKVASQLRVSRIPVREAFFQLAIEGLLERLPNRHMRVVGIDVVQLRQNFSVFGALEGEIAVLALEKGDLSLPQAAIQHCESLTDLSNPLICWNATKQFHLSFSVTVGNRTLQQLYVSQTQALLRLATDSFCFDWNSILNMDRAIWEAAKIGDKENLRRLIKDYYVVLAEEAIRELSL